MNFHISTSHHISFCEALLHCMHCSRTSLYYISYPRTRESGPFNKQNSARVEWNNSSTNWNSIRENTSFPQNTQHCISCDILSSFIELYSWTSYSVTVYRVSRYSGGYIHYEGPRWGKIQLHLFYCELWPPPFFYKLELPISAYTVKSWTPYFPYKGRHCGKTELMDATFFWIVNSWTPEHPVFVLTKLWPYYEGNRESLNPA